MTYSYECGGCGNAFHRSGVSVEHRDDLQACEYCGQGAARVFVATVNLVIPERFGYDLKRLLPTYEDCVTIERDNEQYAATKPKMPSRKPFETLVREELAKLP
jgi:DNA-directed RNA polymerase subunit RPC12/RpoP